jgi:hypothetical protein
MIHWCNDSTETRDFFAYLVAYAPDEFPPEEGLDLDSAFTELRHGIQVSKTRVRSGLLAGQCSAKVEEAYALYRAGRINEGAWALQEAERLFRRGSR